MRSYGHGQLPQIRCAIYTRKSTDEGLEQEFNSLDAQRDAAENYIASQKEQGWVALPDRYDDGGFTGGNIDRPALQQLMADVEAGRIDCVVVYKVDRLSRSLMDFSRLLEVFEKHNVSFVSVTQQFNTTHSMGRLTLNILLSFAQFEREIISERTRDKIAGARRRGKWAGGRPLLGYDLLPATQGTTARLVINEEEAERVREIFRLYLHAGSLVTTVEELNRRGWVNKQWTTKKGRIIGGSPFDTSALIRLLTNVAYLGKVTYRDEIHEGEHEAIVDQTLFDQVRQQLTINRHSGGPVVRNKYGALLKGLVRCASCGCAMVHHFTTRKKRGKAESSIRYRYYVCLKAQKQGWKSCPAASVPAGELEEFVIEQIREIGRDRELIEQVVGQARKKVHERKVEVEAELESVKRRVQRLTKELAGTAGTAGYGHDGHAVARLADLQEQLRDAERRASALRVELAELNRAQADPKEGVRVIGEFEPVWMTLSPKEKARLLQLLVESVEYDGPEGTVTVTFRPTGIQGAAEEMNGTRAPIGEPTEAVEEVSA